MKTIKFIEIRITSFKGIPEFVGRFSEGTTIIEAGNYKGKTTVLDAMYWCLFGKTLLGATRFGIVPDFDLDAIPAIEFLIEINGEEHQLKRRYVNDATVCSIDGVDKPVGQYNDWIEANAVSARRFEVFSNPLYFMTLPQKDQRQSFMNFFEKPNSEEIRASLEEDYIELSEAFEESMKTLSAGDIITKTTTDIKTHERQKAEITAVATHLKEVTRESDKTPVETLKAEKEEIVEKLAKMRDGTSVDEQLQKITEARQELATLRSEYDLEVITDSTAKRNLEAAINAYREEIRMAEHRVRHAAELWKEAEEAGYSTVCPTCKQTLPKENTAENKGRFEKRKKEIEQQ